MNQYIDRKCVLKTTGPNGFQTHFWKTAEMATGYVEFTL